MNLETFSTGDVAKMFGVSPPTIIRYVQDGLLVPAKKARGTGDRHIFSRDDVASLALQMYLTRRGVHRDAAAAVARFVKGANLESAFREGKNLLLLYGNRVYPLLMRKDFLTSALAEWAKQEPSLEWEQIKIVDLSGAPTQSTEATATA